MSNRIVYVISSSQNVRAAGERAARALGWLPLIVPPQRNEGGDDAPHEIREELNCVLSSAEFVCVLSEDNADSLCLEDMVRGLAAQHGCRFLEFKADLSTYRVSREEESRSDKAGTCLVLDDSIEPGNAVLKTVECLTTMRAGMAHRELPFMDLYRMYFTHIQHESNWVNSRFMWFMFASSALMAAFTQFQAGSYFSWTIIVAGLILSIVVLCLQWTTFLAEEEAIKQCEKISEQWGSEVPQIKAYLYGTPAGGNDPTRHVRAKRLMILMIVIFIVVWVILAGLEWGRFPR